ncbi:hypothetical protein KUTeg_016742 [Tegillarca granosa]|uniref:BSD domain-containing protein n=1 Tax=Tegillarca granosa TaxID=220873 RepID=A0ABQ9EQL3_TEGGR|nr:hypothetical protein KUTeg_016742 [Tegillarca granosa]
MAESTNAEASSSSENGGWWNGWFQAAKEKSSQALEFMKKDLTEFTNVMQQESSKAVSKTSETLKETLKTENTAAATDKLKHGISNFLDSVTKALVVETEDKNEPAVRPREEASAIFDRAKARLHAIQVDPGTYYNEPSGSVKNFQEWQKNFDTEKHKGDISELLVSKVEVRALYTKLVPADVSHADFWQRYFYKVHQLQADEARKLALMQRAEMAKKEESINWDEEWSSDEEETKKEKVKQRKPVAENKTKIDNGLSEKEVNQNDSDTKSEQVCQNNENKIDEQHQEVLQSKVSSDDTVVVTKSEINTELNKIKDKETVDDKNKNTDNVKQTDNVSKTLETAEEITSNVKDEDSLKGETTRDQFSKAEIDNVELENKTSNENESSTETVVTSEPEVKDVNIPEKGNNSSENEQLQVEDEKQTNKSDSNVIPETGKSENKVIEISKDEMKLKIKEKNDVVVVNPDRESPSSKSSDVVSLDDDWEQDFDVDLTEEDLKAADEIAKKLNLSSTDYTKIAAEMVF